MIWNVLAIALAASIFAAAPVEAAPVVAAWAAITAGISAITSTVAGAFLFRVAASVVLSALATAIRGKPDAPERPGIRTEATTTGGVNSETFILGRYATSGNLVAPPYSHENSGSQPNLFLTYVVDVSDLPGVQFSRLIVGGEYIDDLQLNTVTGGEHQYEGNFNTNDFGNYPYLWMTWHDGSQTTADAYMIEYYASYPERPWAADMVGQGIAYAVITFYFAPDVYSGQPGVRFEVEGIPLYDPRKDSTVGGTGSHRWANKATWEFSENPLVMIYNILRGIEMPGGRIWGGKAAAEDLPLATWFAAMNVCDEDVALKAGGTEKRYRAGYEVKTADDDPDSVIIELLKACSAEIVEFGGVYKVRVGGPGVPVYYFTDDDIVSDNPQSLVPFHGLESVYNGIHASHPDPKAMWETRDAPPRYNATWEGDDGDRQLIAHVDLPAVSSRPQVQRLMKAWIADERRFRRHSLTLPPDAAVLEPLDSVGWTSARNQYSAEVFEIGELSDDPRSMLQTVAMRARKTGDFDWVPGDEIDVDDPSTIVVTPSIRTVPGWAVSSYTVKDEAGNDRRAALLIEWDGTKVGDAQAIEYEVRAQTQTDLITQGAFTDMDKGSGRVVQGILPSANLEVRGRLVMSHRRRAWTAWTPVLTANVAIGKSELDPSVQATLDKADDVDAELEALTDGFVGKLADIEDDIAEARSDAEDAIAPLQGSGICRKPASNWTNLSHSDVPPPDKRDAIPASWLVTGDAVFGDCAELPLGTNSTIGAAYPFAFKPGRIYKVTVQVRATNNGSSGGAKITICATTWAGSALAERYAQVDAAAALSTSAGEKTYSAYFSTDNAALTEIDAIFSGVLKKHLSGSATANKVYFHVRQNANLTTDGRIRVRSIEVQDVTDAQNAARLVRQELTTSIGAVSANLATNYYLISEVDSAFAATEQTLSVDIGNVQASNFPRDFSDDGKYWQSAIDGAPGTGSLHADFVFVNLGVDGRVARLASNMSGGNRTICTRGVFKPLRGRTYRLTARVRIQGTIVNPSGNHIYMDFVGLDSNYANTTSTDNVTGNAPGDYWVTYTGTVVCDATNDAHYWRPRLGILRDNFTTTGNIEIQQFYYEDVTDVEALSGEIVEIKGLDASALTGTVFGTFLTQMDVDAGGNVAGVTNFGSAMADLHGYSQSSYVFRAKAGGAAGEMKITAWDDPTGSGSRIYLGADAIELDGISVFSGDWIGSDVFTSSFGWRIWKDGTHKFRGAEISGRQLEVASGTVSFPTFTPTNSGGSLLDIGWTDDVMATGEALTAWAGSDATYMALVEQLSGSVTERTGTAPNVYWGFEAVVLPLTKWSGDQTIRLRINYWCKNVSQQAAGSYKWKLYKVT